MLLVKSDTSPVKGHSHMLVLMCVHSDDNLNGTTADVTNLLSSLPPLKYGAMGLSERTKLRWDYVTLL